MDLKTVLRYFKLQKTCKNGVKDSICPAARHLIHVSPVAATMSPAESGPAQHPASFLSSCSHLPGASHSRCFKRERGSHFAECCSIWVYPRFLVIMPASCIRGQGHHRRDAGLSPCPSQVPLNVSSSTRGVLTSTNSPFDPVSPLSRSCVTIV